MGAKSEWIEAEGIMARAFPVEQCDTTAHEFRIEGALDQVSAEFNKGKKTTPFKNAGVMVNRHVCTEALNPEYFGPHITLGDILVPENEVPPEFFIPDNEVAKWEYAKGSKSERRVNKTTGYEYNYSEGAMAFGAAPSRFKHIVPASGGRFRRLIPVELERLNMFPDGHTAGASDMRRAFLMGNALVTGIVERIGLEILRRI